MHVFDGKTVLITGATGLIGSNLCAAILNNSTAKVIALSRCQDKLERVFQNFLSKPNFTCIAKDICEPLAFLERIDCIFHAASPISGAIISEKPVDVILPNVEGIRNCLEFMREQESRSGVKGRTVIFSSATVYGNTTPFDRIVHEDDTECQTKINAPNAPYADSKRMAEILTGAYIRQYDVDAVIARIGYVYGHCREFPNTAFYSFMKTAFDGQNILIHNPSMARRDNIYIDDVISGLLALYERGICGEAYNISSAGEKGNFAAADEMSCEIVNIANQEGYCKEAVKVEYSSEVKQRQPGVLLSNEKLKSLGWELECSLRFGIKKTMDLFLKETK